MAFGQKKTKAVTDKVRKLDMIALGLGDFGYGLVSSTVATYITSFGTMSLPGVSDKGFTATLMGIAVGIAVIFDAISDPIMGFISDHFNSKIFGKRHLFMLIGLIGMMASALAVWYIPYESMNGAGIFIWFAVFLILLRTFNTMYYTPVGAFSVEISTDYNERTTIQAVRSILYIIGMLLCVVVMGSFQNIYAGYYDGATLVYHCKEVLGEAQELALGLQGLEFRKGQQVATGYRVFSLVSTGITVITSAFMLLVTRRYIGVLRLRDEKDAIAKGIDLNVKQEKLTRQGCRKELIENGNANPTARQVSSYYAKRCTEVGQITLGAVLSNFFGAFKVKEMRIIAIGYVIAMMSATLIISLGFNVFTFTFDLTTLQMYFLMGALLLCTIGSQFVWGKIAKKKSKQFAMFLGLVISFIGCLILFTCFLCRNQINAILLSDQTAWGVTILCPALMIAGFGTGVLYSMPLALIGDVVVLQKELTGEDKTGTFAGVMTFCFKAGQGIVTAISTALLDVIHFKTGAATQPPEAKEGIGWILCIGVIIFVGLGIVVFSRLKLDKQKISEILDRQRQEVIRLQQEQANSDAEAVDEVAANAE